MPQILFMADIEDRRAEFRRKRKKGGNRIVGRTMTGRIVRGAALAGALGLGGAALARNPQARAAAADAYRMAGQKTGELRAGAGNLYAGAATRAGQAARTAKVAVKRRAGRGFRRSMKQRFGGKN